MGAILAANGIGAAFATQLFAPLINAGKYGYRNAYLLTVFVLLAVLVLVLLFFRNNPKRIEAGDVSQKTGRDNNWEGIEFSVAVKQAPFYIVCVCVFLAGMVLQGITGVAAAYLDDVGLGAYVATILSVHSLTLTFSKFFAGFSYDRFGLRITSGFCMSVAVVAMILLVVLPVVEYSLPLAFMYAVCAAFALPLETIMLPIYAKDLFGNRSYEKFLGIFVSINTVGYATGGFAVNLCFDTFGSYTPAFVICAVILMVVLILMQYVISVSSKEI